MSDSIAGIEINGADDGSFALNRALWKQKLIEVYIVADKMAPPNYIGNYIVSFWHENEDKPRDEMRVRVQGVLQGPVLSLLQSSCVTSLPCVVHINVRGDELSNSSIIDQPINSAYAQELALASNFTMASASPSHVPALYELESILFISAFESGSAGAYLVKTHHGGDSVVLKILLESDFFLHTDEEMFSFKARLAAMYREMNILMTIPPHPNIIKPPVALVTVSRGTIAESLDSFLNAEPPCAPRRIRWAGQIASAIHHIHRVACTYHGDIKLDNVVLSANDDAVLIDFEQGRHAEGCLAPEACGEWDVVANIPTSDSEGNLNAVTIRYIRYTTGSERDDSWSAYEAWAIYPEALERIEIFSLGDALRTLFEGALLPHRMQSIIERCVSDDPAARPRLDSILTEMNELVSIAG